MMWRKLMMIVLCDLVLSSVCHGSPINKSSIQGLAQLDKLLNSLSGELKKDKSIKPEDIEFSANANSWESNPREGYLSRTGYRRDRESQDKLHAVTAEHGNSNWNAFRLYGSQREEHKPEIHELFDEPKTRFVETKSEVQINITRNGNKTTVPLQPTQGNQTTPGTLQKENAKIRTDQGEEDYLYDDETDKFPDKYYEEEPEEKTGVLENDDYRETGKDKKETYPEYDYENGKPDHGTDELKETQNNEEKNLFDHRAEKDYGWYPTDEKGISEKESEKRTPEHSEIDHYDEAEKNEKEEEYDNVEGENNGYGSIKDQKYTDVENYKEHNGPAWETTDLGEKEDEKKYNLRDNKPIWETIDSGEKEKDNKENYVHEDNEPTWETKNFGEEHGKEENDNNEDNGPTLETTDSGEKEKENEENYNYEDNEPKWKTKDFGEKDEYGDNNYYEDKEPMKETMNMAEEKREQENISFQNYQNIFNKNKETHSDTETTPVPVQKYSPISKHSKHDFHFLSANNRIPTLIGAEKHDSLPQIGVDTQMDYVRHRDKLHNYNRERTNRLANIAQGQT